MSASKLLGSGESFTMAGETTPALNSLQKLGPDEYIIAFGPEGRQFCGTPNGYSATNLPLEIQEMIANGTIRKILGASFGSSPDSWLFHYKSFIGTHCHQFGRAVPEAAKVFLTFGARGLEHSRRHVQLGDAHSFVAWAESQWQCSGIPTSLRDALCQLSSHSFNSQSSCWGTLARGTLKNVQWHQDGSFFIQMKDRHIGTLEADMARKAWLHMWSEGGVPSKDSIGTELAYAAINSHAPIGDTFAFIKRQHKAKEAPFILRFGKENVKTNIKHWDTPARVEQSLQGQQHRQKQQQEEQQEQQQEQQQDGFKMRFAISKKSGRPHLGEDRELYLNAGQKITVFKDMGRNWYVAEDMEGTKGWVHGSWLDFEDRKARSREGMKKESNVHTRENAPEAYSRFVKHIQSLFLADRNLCDFPSLAPFMAECTLPECEQTEGDKPSVGICRHDLAKLLEGSGQYSFEWLKEQRNMWHPDRFARFCHAAHADRLKLQAEQMFVLYGQLMDEFKE